MNPSDALKIIQQALGEYMNTLPPTAKLFTSQGLSEALKVIDSRIKEVDNGHNDSK